MAGRRQRAALLVLGAILVACSGGNENPSPVASMSQTPSAAVTNRTPGIAAAVCRGPDVDWSALPAVAEAYGRAWNERDPAARRALLQQAWTDDGSYVDPTMSAPVAGREAMIQHIGAFLEGRPGQYFEPAWIASDQHHGYLQMRWRLCGQNGQVDLEGVDFGELGSDGRIKRSTGFFAIEPVEQSRPVCQPAAGEWSGIPDVARKWAAAAASDDAEHAALIREVWAEGGSYVDPSDQSAIVGRAAIAERVAGMLWEGAFFEAAAWTAGDDHHGSMRLRWRLCSPEGPGLEGTDFVELAADGRFQRVVGFFPWP